MAKARLSSTFEALSGRIGTTVLANDQDGTSVRAYNPMSKQPFTTAQLAREAAFTQANQTWTTIGLPAATAWRDYGRTQKVRNELSGKYRTREGKDCFVGQYAKLLQMNASAAVPVPPVGAFVTDNVVVSVVAGSGVATWTGSKSNHAGVTTELLAQRIPSEVALPTPDGYRTQAFFAFSDRTLSTTTPLAPGFWAFAIQFVDTATGRVAGIRPLGTGRVTLALVQGGADDSATPVRLKKAA